MSPTMKKAPKKDAAKKAKVTKSFKRFSQEERALAFKWLGQGKTPGDIADLLGRDKGTISRQLAKPKNTVPQLGRKKVITEAHYQTGGAHIVVGRCAGIVTTSVCSCVEVMLQIPGMDVGGQVLLQVFWERLGR